jgi:hypothetical protein
VLYDFIREIYYLRISIIIIGRQTVDVLTDLLGFLLVSVANQFAYHLYPFIYSQQNISFHFFPIIFPKRLSQM